MAYRIVRPDGVIRHVIAKGVAQFDEQEQLEALRGGVLDVTERKKSWRPTWRKLSVFKPSGV